MPDNSEQTVLDLVPHESGEYYNVSDENLTSHPAVRRVADMLSQTASRVLDIGCGTGTFGSLLGPACEYTGVDLHVSQDLRLRFQCSHQLRAMDACQPFPFCENSFDAVTSFWCLEHLPRPEVTLREAARVLRPGGTMVLMFPNYDNPLRRCPSWWCSKEADDSWSSACQRGSAVELLLQVRRRGSYLVRQFFKQLQLDIFRRRSIFEINHDPACLHLPWSRDRDAIHLVASRSVSRFLIQQMKFQSAVLPGVDSGVRMWLLNFAPETLLVFRKGESVEGKTP